MCKIVLDEKKYINSLRLAYSLTAFLAFLSGVSIYVFFRDTDNIILFQIFSKFSFLNSFYIPVKTGSIWLSMLLYNLPDGFWCLSGLFIIRSIWLTNIKWFLIYKCVFIAIAFIFEFMQISEKIPGTFDPLDLIFMSGFIIVESIILKLPKTSNFAQLCRKTPPN